MTSITRGEARRAAAGGLVRRVLEQDEDRLGDEELLAVVLGGRCLRRDAVSVGDSRSGSETLRDSGSDSRDPEPGTVPRPIDVIDPRDLLDAAGGLRKLSRRPARDLMECKGIGPVRAARLRATFALARRLLAAPLDPGVRIRSSRDVYLHYHPLLRDLRKERFLVLLLDCKNRLIREECVSEGSLTASIVHPREVFQAAILESAASILALHNHPSGDPSPSREDYEITVRLKDAGCVVGIELMDHIVLADRGFVSFREHRLIDWAED